MRNCFKPFLIVSVIFLLNSCFDNNSRMEAIGSDQVVLTVNGEKITAKQFDKVLKTQKKIFRVQNFEELKTEELVWIKTRGLNEIIRNTLIAQEIAKENISIEQNVLESNLRKVREGYLEGAFEKTLDLEGISIADWEKSIEKKLLTNELIHQQVNSKVSLSDKELRDYYDKNHNEFHKKQQVKALHIMVESEEEIREIQKELRSKQKTFPALAMEYSLGPEGAQGGDLGYFEAGQMPEEFDDVFKLKINKVSDIIKTPYGFHLLKVVDKIEERKMDFEESKSRVEKILLEYLQDQAFKKWFLKLKENAEIEIEYESLEKIN
ncbi:peptidylprolyl isomerase [Nitrospinaceae bacterium]|nr:peptidylprolyl isomerase [Nitrospinaceae bacterium]